MENTNWCICMPESHQINNNPLISFAFTIYISLDRMRLMFEKWCTITQCMFVHSHLTTD